MRNKIFILCLMALLGFVGNVWSQPLQATLQFLSDTTYIGAPVKVAVTFKHPKELTVLFPDSSNDYFPFEYISQEFFTTKSDSASSLDSAVYTLNTFEILPYPALSMPLMYVEGEDSTTFYTNTGEIFLDEVIRTVTTEPAIQENTQYRLVGLDLNYPYLLIGIAAFILIVGGVALFFRKKILRAIKLYFARQQFGRFIAEFDKLKDTVSKDNAKESLERILSLWKKYLEKLEGIPYTTYTSREITFKIDYNKLSESLLSLDKCVYGGIYSDDVHKSLRTLRDTAYSRYQKKTHDLKNV